MATTTIGVNQVGGRWAAHLRCGPRSRTPPPLLPAPPMPSCPEPAPSPWGRPASNPPSCGPKRATSCSRVHAASPPTVLTPSSDTTRAPALPASKGTDCATQRQRGGGGGMARRAGGGGLLGVKLPAAQLRDHGAVPLDRPALELSHHTYAQPCCNMASASGTSGRTAVLRRHCGTHLERDAAHELHHT